MRRTVLEYERVVRYDRGRLAGLAGPGRIWYRPWRTRLLTVDLRPRTLTVPGQELLTADGVPVKVSVATVWRVTDPVAYVQEARCSPEVLYLTLQLALRAAVAASAVDGLLSGRDELNERVRTEVVEAVTRYGVAVDTVAVRDLMLPGETKRLFAQVVAARQEGLAALERARGETAALRALANLAQVLERNPALLQLRALLAAESANSTVVITPSAANGTGGATGTG